MARLACYLRAYGQADLVRVRVRVRARVRARVRVRVRAWITQLYRARLARGSS